MSRKTKKPKAPSVDLHQVERLADLSRLSLDEKEVVRLKGELSSILGYFAALDRVRVPRSILAPDASGGGSPREDLARPSDPEEILRGVPNKKGRYVRAPRVF